MRRLSAGILRLLHTAKQRTRRRFTPLGHLLLWCVLMAAILAPNPAFDTMAYFTLLAALLAVGLAGTRLQGTHLQAERRLPRHCTLGEPLHYQVCVTNTGHRTIRGVTVVDELQRSYPQTFHGFRKWRIQWLLGRGGSIAPAMRNVHLAPGASCNVDLQLTAHRRGLLHFERLHLLLTDPLGLCRRPLTLPVSESIISLPPRYPVHPIQHATGGIGRRKPVARSGISPDFLYLRDYRHGDPIQRVDWSGYARHGHLLVRVYEHPDTPHLGLLLDTCTPRDQAHHLEAAASVAASLLTSSPTYTDHPTPSALIIGSHVRMHVPQPLDPAGRWEMLKHVACATAEPEAHLPRFTAATRSMARELGIETLVGVFLTWDEPRQALCEELRRNGHRVLALVVAPAPTQDRTADTPVPGGTVYLDTAHLAQALDRPLCAV